MMRKDTQTTTLYRMVMPDHLGPFRLMSKDLLERQGYSVDDHHLETRKQTDAFKEEHGVETTPQAFIDGERIGGYDELRMRRRVVKCALGVCAADREADDARNGSADRRQDVEKVTHGKVPFFSLLTGRQGKS
tara:strand:- start:1296 stop:1694 length:399 start_codon:yes stop_codon:yes gene_type:complete